MNQESFNFNVVNMELQDLAVLWEGFWITNVTGKTIFIYVFHKAIVKKIDDFNITVTKQDVLDVFNLEKTERKRMSLSI